MSGRGKLRVVHTAMTPLCDETGKPRMFGPYRPQPNPCDLCPGRCCRFQVEVSLPDAVELCSTLGVPFFAVMTVMPAEGRRAVPLAPDLRFVRPGDEWRGQGEIVLRRERDGSCHFLASHDGYRRCTAYGARPSACRLYPLAWQDDVERGGPATIACAVPYPVTPSIEEQFVRDFERAQARWAVHDEILAAWRALPEETDRRIEAFLAFAAPRAAERFGLSLGPMLAAGAADHRLLEAMVAAGLVRK